MYLLEMPGFAVDLSQWTGPPWKGGCVFSRHACKALIVQNGSDKSYTAVLLCSCPVSADLLCSPEQNYRVYFSSIHSGRCFFEDSLASRVDGSQWGDESSIIP